MSDLFIFYYKLLGLDGSLLFLEHVFWVISLNTLFILVFGLYILLFNREFNIEIIKLNKN